MLARRFLNILILPKMSIFTQNINPITGINVWEEKDPNYDYHLEIARSAFADMLHDRERNLKYYAALKLAITKKHAAGEKANVLDIGTGTGLLSMMAAECGADSIVACETFLPMAKCAEKIIKENGFADKIKLVYKRSNKLTVGNGCDLEKKANILVTEVFDTELIGEGALSTFKHAQEYLLEENSIVIPSKGTIWAQVVSSPLVNNWNRVNSIKDESSGKVFIEPPSIVESCSGASAVHDIQLSQLPIHSFKPLIKPQPIFSFDWSGKVPLIFDESIEIKTKSIATGTAHAVFMWWDLDMDTDGQVLLSCAPVWQHPDIKTEIINEENVKKFINEIPWRDHWMQAIYYFPKDLHLSVDNEVFLTASHDEYSFWFSLNKISSDVNIEKLQRPKCECNVHLAFSRTRIGQWNDNKRNQKYLEFAKKKIAPNSVGVCLTDGSLLSLAIAKMGVKKLFVLESNFLSKKTTEMFVKHNKISNVTFVESIEKLPSSEEIDFIFAEPYYITSILPWDNLHYWYIASKYSKNILRTPKRAVIYGLVMEFKDLHKIRAPLGICENFDLSIFDNLVQSSSDKADDSVEAQPLWEYPGKALSNTFAIVDFNLYDNVYEMLPLRINKKIPIETNGLCNGIAIWIDWYVDDDLKVSTGPTTDVTLGNDVSWDPYTRQGVHLLHKIKEVSKSSSLILDFAFNPQEGDLIFNFEVKQNKK